MANYSTLKAAVADVVKTNGAQAITGANLQSVLLSIINSVGGGGYIFAGVATPSTNPGTPDQNVFYIGGAGTYANFGTSVTVPVGSICLFKYNGSWAKEQINISNIDVQPANSPYDLDISDERGYIIAGFGNGEIQTKNFNSAKTPTIDVEEVADFSISDINNNIIGSVVNGYPITKNFNGKDIANDTIANKNDIIALKEVSPTIDPVFGWEKLDTNNPLLKIRFDAGLTPVIRHWGFIGDSLSSGCHGYDTGIGTATGDDIYDYSWGQFICRLCGSEGKNFSYGGGMAKTWLSNQTYGWPVAQQTENFKQAYTIAFGINDSTLLSTTYPDGVGDADTDLVVSQSNPYDYSHNNENTFVGCYGGIIQRLRSVNPRCRIFVITMLDKNNNNSTHLAIDAEIRKIALKFENVYLIDLATYAPQYYGSLLYDELVYWSHLTSVGYVWLAYLINTYIDWIIRQNLYAFRDIAFIGTDKYMNQDL